MTWREDLRRTRVTIDGRTRDVVGASFRGVPFLIESVERGGGRRAVVHEFPLRDDPFVEDLGRRARTFRADGYVIGDEYLTAKNALLDALESESGPGELILPYYGGRAIRAICVNLAVRETRAEGGWAIFSLEFAEAPTQAPTPTIVVDSVSEVAAGADTAIAAGQAEFVERYDPAGLPSFALASASTALTNVASGMGVLLAPAVSVTQELAAMTAQIEIITSTASALVRQPHAVLTAFRAAIVVLGETITAAPGAVMDALIDAYLIDMGTPIVETTATRERERVNQVAIIGGLRRVIAIEAARLAPLVPYESIEQAFAARDQLATMLESEAAGAGDTAYPALVDLRSQLLRSVPGAGTFARVVTITRRVAIPSLLLAYQLYGSVDNEADIIARNAIRHPGFVAGDLKVLSDG